MKQGLLFKDSPEPSIELYCNALYQEGPEKWNTCNILFDSVEKFVQHRREFHNEIFATYGQENVRYFQEPRFYPRDYSKDLIEVPFKFKSRPVKRFNVTQQMLDYLQLKGKERTCWCGKHKSDWEYKYQRLYCSPEHSEEWTYERVPFWNWYRDHILNKQYHKNIEEQGHYGYVCELCDIKKVPHQYQIYGDSFWNLDHIIAIMNGGHPWHRDNLQIICRICHVAKTKEDHQVRREKQLENSIMILDDMYFEKPPKRETALPPGQMTL